MIYKRPDKIFDATSCGENCAKWLLEIGKKRCYDKFKLFYAF